MARPPRIPGFDYLGPYRYFLTFCTHRRRTVFDNTRDADAALAQIRRAADTTKFALLAYCLMPDHAHLLTEGLDRSSNLRAFVTSAKKRSGIAYSRRTGGGPLWQEGYYDRVLREGDDVRAVLRYIVENPVRAGLARSPAEYPYLGSCLWTVEQLIDGSMFRD